MFFKLVHFNLLSRLEDWVLLNPSSIDDIEANSNDNVSSKFNLITVLRFKNDVSCKEAQFHKFKAILSRCITSNINLARNTILQKNISMTNYANEFDGFSNL